MFSGEAGSNGLRLVELNFIPQLDNMFKIKTPTGWPIMWIRIIIYLWKSVDDAAAVLYYAMLVAGSIFCC
jgi:hypothetical protein